MYRTNHRLGRRLAALVSASALGFAGLSVAMATTSTASAEPNAATARVDNATFTWGLNGYGQEGIFGPWEFSKPTGDARLLKGSVSGGNQTEYVVAGVPKTSMPPSNPQKTPNAVKFTGGDGTVDRASGAATLAWQGSYTVNAYPEAYNAPDEIYTDPKLRVEPDGSGVLSMEFELGGGETMTGEPVKPQKFGRLKIATFDAGSLSAKTSEGYRVTPDYQGVKFDAAEESAAQVRNCSDDGGATGWWGAWPTEFLDALSSNESGRSVVAHFYSTGCAGKQDFKPSLPIDVTFVEKPSS